ncbi:MAG: hypothetical protein JJU36_13640 [Phycisphaeraceae bacterium]|nr:hypothetical protein [Phycisphaeraceae bacterium]
MFKPFDDDHILMRAGAMWLPEDRPDQGADGPLIVALFRCRLSLANATAPEACWITASQRYELYLDGQPLSRGPSRSDPMRWGARCIELPAMEPGEHLLAVRVVHFGRHSGIGQLGNRPFLAIAADVPGGTLDTALSDPDHWRCLADESVRPIEDHPWGGKRPYFVVGCGERMIGGGAHSGWTEPHTDDSSWLRPRLITRSIANPWGNLPLDHQLGADPLPAMEEQAGRFSRIASGPESLHSDATIMLNGKGSLTIPPRTEATLILDYGELTNAYWSIRLSGGARATIDIINNEAPFAGEGKAKLHRDTVENAHFWGLADRIEHDGGPGRTYRPLWFRSFRYLKLDVLTADDPLTIEDISTTTTGYPLPRRSSFQAQGEHAAELERIFEVSHRTARLCAHETFFDCPHYEQAQFPGDSRVQAIYHYLVANDDRLARKALDDFFASRLPDGLTQCRFPSRRLQILPTFSLQWVGMLADFLLYRGDPAFCRPYLPFAREVIGWFERRLRPDGLLGRIPQAPFIDWTEGFAQGNAPQAPDGRSVMLTLILAEACRDMAFLEHHAGEPKLASGWKRRWKARLDAVRKQGWDRRRGMFTDIACAGAGVDGSSEPRLSIHTQTHAVLADAVIGRRASGLIRRALASSRITPAGSFYFRFHIARALRRAGVGELFFDMLPRWREVLDRTGLTTWPETDHADPRSDCHAWSVTPAIEYFQTILGIEPVHEAPGFAAIRLDPKLGPLPGAQGKLHTPTGTVEVTVNRGDDGLAIQLRTPVPCHIAATGATLGPGEHELTLDAPTS